MTTDRTRRAGTASRRAVHGLALPDPRFEGAACAVRCANATTRWVNGVNGLAEVPIGR
ncbi:hypothetical protein [Streptomyces atratus]|uniref:hypothetical protein n=1 Tax=Streptomyces atratus TaxID=1893 RepID=UPI003402517E